MLHVVGSKLSDVAVRLNQRGTMLKISQLVNGAGFVFCSNLHTYKKILVKILIISFGLFT